MTKSRFLELTPEDGRLIVRLRNEGKTFKEIGEVIGCSLSACQKYLVRYGGQVRKQIKGRINDEPIFLVAPNEVLEQRDVRMNAYYSRDLTSSLLGDPPRGFSALDEKRK